MSPIRTYVYRRPELYPAQLEAIFAEKRHAIIEASTKSGKTHGCMAWLFEQAAIHGGPGKRYWWVAPVLDQAAIAFRRMRDAARGAPATAIESVMEIRLDNGSVIHFRSGDNPDSLYGEDVHAAVLDEASRMKEAVWTAVRTTLTATTGSVRIIGNVRGRRNWAYRLARRAEGGEIDWQYARLTWEDAVVAGIFPVEEVEAARRDLSEHEFRELYEAIAEDDFRSAFGLDSILACIGPLSSGEPVAWGWDIASDVDFTVGVALDAKKRVCRFVRFQGSFGDIEEKILEATDRVPAVVDSTGLGAPIVEKLQRQGVFEGFLFTSRSKQELIENLKLAIHRCEVVFPEGPIQAELELFESERTSSGIRYSAPSGSHDDCVIALALALRAFQNMPGQGVW